MQNPFSKNEMEIPFDDLIAQVLIEMNTQGVTSDEYSSLMAYLERLYELKAKESPKRVSRDTIALVVGNLVGILLIVAYEQKHVMSQKGINNLIRPK